MQSETVKFHLRFLSVILVSYFIKLFNIILTYNAVKITKKKENITGDFMF
jgi:hypothetical protein